MFTKEIPTIYEHNDLCIQATDILNKWKNGQGDKFFVFGNNWSKR